MGRTMIRMVQRLSTVLIIASLSLVTSSIGPSNAHQDACHRLHRCLSDHHTYVCGDTGRCDQGPDNQFCLAASSSPAPAQPTSTSTQPSTACGITVCFTPRGHCTELIVNAIAGATASILVQTDSFTSAPIATALLEAHTRGVRVEVILDQSNRSDKYSAADFLAKQGCRRRSTPATPSRIIR